MKGRFSVSVERLPGGANRLVRQFVSSPFHLSKPHQNSGTLCIQASSASPGILPGDHLDLDISVSPDAACSFTTSSSQKAYAPRSREYPPALSIQRLTVAQNGILLFCPKMLIPHHGARFRQITEIHLEETSQLIFAELVAPGRAQQDDPLSSELLESKLQLFISGSLIFRDNLHITPEAPSRHILLRVAAAPFLASILCVSKNFETLNHRATLESLQNQIDSLGSGSTSLSFSSSFLTPSCLLTRIISASPILLRRAAQTFYDTVKTLLPVRLPPLPL